MELIYALILGLVEGFTEFLPISSTGHLVLTSSLLGIEQTGFVKSFEIAIQSGAMLAVVALFWRSFLDLEIMKRVATAFVPTSVVGLALYSFFRENLLGNESIIVWALLGGGIFFILFELLYRQKESKVDLSKIPYKKCFAIGLFQSVSIIPGVSRAGASIIGGLLMGLRRDVVVQFSFLLAVPTLIAATGFDMYQSSAEFSQIQIDALVVGIVVSFVAAIAAIKFLMKFIKKHTFIPFGVYRIVAALTFFFLILA